MARTAKMHPLLGDPLPFQFSRKEIVFYGFNTLCLVREQYYRFSDAFNEVAHSRMMFRMDDPVRYDMLKEEVENYCREHDLSLFLRAENRPWGNHLRIRNGAVKKPCRLEPSIESTPVPQLLDALWTEMEYSLYVHWNRERLFERAFDRAARNNGLVCPSALYDQLFGLMIARCTEKLPPEMKNALFSNEVPKPPRKKGRAKKYERPQQIALPL